MATRGWQDVSTADLARLGHRATPASPPPSKYRNRKTVIGDQCFDSQREANDWLTLLARQDIGAITELRRQVIFPLYAAVRKDGVVQAQAIEVAQYVADFVYRENGHLVVQDSKGMRTKEYRLKRRWLAAQDAIEIRET